MFHLNGVILWTIRGPSASMGLTRGYGLGDDGRRACPRRRVRPSPMLPLAAVVIDPAGVKPASFAELAAGASAIPLIMVESGGDAVPLLNNRRVIEALQLRSSILLLFEDATEAEAFKKTAGTTG